MPNVEWMSVGRELGNDVEVYIRDAPSTIVNWIDRISLWALTLHQDGTEELQYEVKFLFFPAVLYFKGINFVCLFSRNVSLFAAPKQDTNVVYE